MHTHFKMPYIGTSANSAQVKAALEVWRANSKITVKMSHNMIHLFLLRHDSSKAKFDGFRLNDPVLSSRRTDTRVDT